jgi:hypothetical protein
LDAALVPADQDAFRIDDKRLASQAPLYGKDPLRIVEEIAEVILVAVKPGQRVDITPGDRGNASAPLGHAERMGVMTKDAG